MHKNSCFKKIEWKSKKGNENPLCTNWSKTIYIPERCNSSSSKVEVSTVEVNCCTVAKTIRSSGMWKSNGRQIEAGSTWLTLLSASTHEGFSDFDLPVFVESTQKHHFVCNKCSVCFASGDINATSKWLWFVHFHIHTLISYRTPFFSPIIF